MCVGDACPSSEEAAADTHPPRRPLWGVQDVVKVLVFVDMFSVALVVPLLSSYFMDLDISTEQYGLMSSAYSMSQIIGGLVFGALSDHALSRRSVLVISFLGSALSYGTIGLSSSLGMLLVGRVVVGLVKQTMTIATAMVSENTPAETRSAELSKLGAAMTLSFIIGPAMGSFLYGRNKKTPPLVAATLFLLNVALALLLLPSGSTKAAGGQTAADAAAAAAVGKMKAGGDTDTDKGDGKPSTTTSGAARDAAGADAAGALARKSGKSAGAKPTACDFWTNFKIACSSGPILRILVAKIIYGFLLRALGSQNFPGYFEERYGVGTGMLGYMSSYTAGMSFVVQVYVVGRLTAWTDEITLVSMALAIITVMNAAEGAPSISGLRGYLALLVPARAVANAVLGACLQSIFTQRVPQGELGAALGVQNIILSGSGVVAPLYGGKLLGFLGIVARPTACAAHYAAFLLLWWAMEARGGGAGGGGGGRGPKVAKGRGGASGRGEAASVDSLANKKVD